MPLLAFPLLTRYSTASSSELGHPGIRFRAVDGAGSLIGSQKLGQSWAGHSDDGDAGLRLSSLLAVLQSTSRITTTRSVPGWLVRRILLSLCGHSNVRAT